MKLHRLDITNVLLLILVLSLASVSGYAQFIGNPKAKKARSALKIDHAVFRGEQPENLRLEVYYQLFNFGLKFKEVESRFIANYRLITSITGKKNKVVAVDTVEKKITLKSKKRTRSPYDYRTSQLNFELPPGKYKVKMSLFDKSSKKVLNREFKIKLKKFKTKQPQCSDVEFVQSVHEGKSESGPFVKGNLDIIPSVSKIYGGKDSAHLIYYFEIYRGEKVDDFERVLVETRMRHRSKGMVYRDTVWADLDNDIVRQVRDLSLNEFPAGDYELEIYIRGRRNKTLDKNSQDFTLAWSPGAMIRHDWKTAMGQLSYIADPGELNDIKKLKSVEERKAAFDAFWEERDPSKGTPLNEKKVDFYRRVSVANKEFTALMRPGWKTDRGMIYIKNGRPDDVDDVPYSPSDVPYQIWHYYRQGEYLRFTFVDENQDGDFRLQYPYDGRGQRPDF